MDVFGIVVCSIMGVCMFMNFTFLICDFIDKAKEKKQQEKDELQERLNSLSRDNSDFYHDIRKLEQELLFIGVRVHSLENKIEKGKSKN